MTDGTLERRGDRGAIRFERRLRHPVDRVWRALTEPGEIAAWLALAELDLVEPAARRSSHAPPRINPGDTPG